MLISHKYKFVCVNIPKTATGTREAALGEYCELSIFKPGFKIAYGRHAPAHIAKSIFFENGWIWDDYYKFSFVRNPHFRYISFYNMMVKQGRTRANFSEWFASRVSENFPQCYYYKDAHGESNILDKIYKYENLNESMADVFKIVGIKNQPILNNPENAPEGGFIYDIRKYYDLKIYNRVISLEKDVINKFYFNDLAL
jgi:hypothetical protein